MDDIGRVVDETVQQCREEGKTVSETLAAFVARAVVYQYAERFQLDQQMTEADINDLIKLCVERLLTKDSPGVETIAMQVAFDEAYVLYHPQIVFVFIAHLIYCLGVDNLVSIVAAFLVGHRPPGDDMHTSGLACVDPRIGYTLHILTATP